MSEFTEIKTILECQSHKINDIHFAIYGNEKAGVNGMAEKLKDHEKYIQNDRKFKWIVAGAFAGTSGGIIAWIKSHLGV